MTNHIYGYCIHKKLKKKTVQKYNVVVCCENYKWELKKSFFHYGNYDY